MPTPVHAQKPPSWFKPRPGNRKARCAEARESLKNSIAKLGILNPLIARADGLLIGGHGRLDAALELGLPTIPVNIYPAEMSDLDVMALAFVDNDLRQDMSDQERTLACKEMEDAGASRSEIAEKISMSAGAVTRILSPFDCIEEVRDAFFAGKLTCGDAYTIKGAPDQLAALNQRLAGAKRDDVAKAGRQRNSNANMVKAKSIQVVMDKVVVTFQGDVSLDSAITAAAAAEKVMTKAKAEGHDAQTFAALQKKKKRVKKAQAAKPVANGDAPIFTVNGAVEREKAAG